MLFRVLEKYGLSTAILVVVGWWSATEVVKPLVDVAKGLIQAQTTFVGGLEATQKQIIANQGKIVENQITIVEILRRLELFDKQHTERDSKEK